MAVPNTFASATTSIPLANLDANFAYYDAAYSIVSTTITFNGIVKITGLTSGRVPYATTAGQFTDSANLTFNGTTLTAAGLAGPHNGTVGATTPATGAFTTLSASSTVSGTGFSTYLASPPAIGGTTAAAGAFTTLSASSTVSGAGFSTYLASPPAIGGTAQAAGSFTTLSYTSTLTGGTGIVNLGSNQFYKDASGNIGIGVVPSGSAIVEIKAGSATQAPMQLDAGTLMTTPVAGSLEFDGNAFYTTDDVTGGRGYIPSVHYFRLTADGSAAGPAISNFFGATSGVTLDANIFYEVEANLFFTKTTAGTATFTMTFTQAPVNNEAWYVGTPVGGIGTVGTPQTAAIAKSTATAGALPVTGSLTTAVNHQYTLRAMFQANATTGGTLNLQITSSAGTVTPLTGSYYKITRLPSANSGAFV
ncbi:hypothetical protein UFOVP10_54 [uncultured Caudovirales phage]|uniref:Uncharacterized protein n=1 Tax=uncultured Caudovirales phage TaxID=2100421 RepID=A0A6J5KIM4_9CAUD|nr:hypothetical protein UFOVP10_54 [uncultured Caudovirales phage]